MLIEIDIPGDQLGVAITTALQAKGASVESSAPPTGVDILQVKRIVAKTAGAPEVIQFLLTFGMGIASNLISNWLYDLIKHHAINLRIGGKPVAIDRQSIQKAIDEQAAQKE